MQGSRQQSGEGPIERLRELVGLVGIDGELTIEYKILDISNQYHPFGMVIQDRSWTNTDSSYRYGFNGQAAKKPGSRRTRLQT